MSVNPKVLYGLKKIKGARASGSVRPRTTKWSTFRAPSSPTEWVAAMAATTARAATGDPAPHDALAHRSTHSRRLKPATTLPSPTNEDVAVVRSQRHRSAKPTTAGPSLPRSKPFITTETTRTFQIRRGRKTTLITVATRGKSSSPIQEWINTAAAPNVFFSSPSHHPFFLKCLCLHFRHQGALHLQIQVVHHVDPIKSTASNPSPDTASISPARARLHPQPRRCLRPWSPHPRPPAHHRLHMLRCQHDATASLARCQLPAIPHVGNV
ncbi:hypothetical protein ACLOJK_040481, partial [Asimina triloba]